MRFGRKAPALRVGSPLSRWTSGAAGVSLLPVKDRSHGRGWKCGGSTKRLCCEASSVRVGLDRVAGSRIRAVNRRCLPGLRFMRGILSPAWRCAPEKSEQKRSGDAEGADAERRDGDSGETPAGCDEAGRDGTDRDGQKVGGFEDAEASSPLLGGAHLCDCHRRGHGQEGEE